jgi:hypothetical protein
LSRVRIRRHRCDMSPPQLVDRKEQSPDQGTERLGDCRTFAARESHAASHTLPLSRNERAMKKSRMVAMAGTCTKSLKGEDRSAVLDSTIDGERVMWGLIADGHAGKEGAETCALELLPWLVEHAVDGSAKALHVAVQAGFKSMHEKVPPCLAHAKTHLGACTPLQQLLFGYSLRPCCTRRALSLSLPHLSLRRHRSARFTAVRGPP